MNSRYGAGTIYFFVIIATLLMRMAGGLGVYDAVNVDSDVFFTLVVQLLCFGALPLLGYFIVSKQLQTDQIKPLLRDFNFRKCSLRNFGYCLGVTLPILFLTGVISFAWQNVLALIGYTHSAADPVTPTVGAFIADVVLVAVLPGIFEEVTHRGLVFAAYRDSGYKVVVVSALLFALMHQYIPQTGYTFVIGLLLALMTYYTGSIFPAMFVHFFNNFISVFSDYAELNVVFKFVDDARTWLYTPGTGTIVMLVCAVASVGLLFFFFDKMRTDAVKCGRVPEKFFEKPWRGAIPLYKDVPFILTVAVGVVATIFSFVWGVM